MNWYALRHLIFFTSGMAMGQGVVSLAHGHKYGFILLLGGLVVIGWCTLKLAIKRAPRGYQDKDGFHYG
jgi:hypothetical protein